MSIEIHVWLKRNDITLIDTLLVKEADLYPQAANLLREFSIAEERFRLTTNGNSKAFLKTLGKTDEDVPVLLRESEINFLLEHNYIPDYIKSSIHERVKRELT